MAKVIKRGWAPNSMATMGKSSINRSFPIATFCEKDGNSQQNVGGKSEKSMVDHHVPIKRRILVIWRFYSIFRHAHVTIRHQHCIAGDLYPIIFPVYPLAGSAYKHLKTVGLMMMMMVGGNEAYIRAL